MEAVNTGISDADSVEDDETEHEETVGASGEPTLGQVLLAVEELWPESLAEDWDEVGLVVGRPTVPVTKVLFAVDPTLAVIDEAIEWGAGLLITHHPCCSKG